MKLKNKINVKRRRKKDQHQSGLIFYACDSSHETEITISEKIIKLNFQLIKC